MAGAFPPLPFQKGAMGAEVPFHHRCRSRKIFGVRRIFFRISPNLPEKFFVQFCQQIFSHKDHEGLFLVWSPKKGLHVFFHKLWVWFLEVKQRWAPFIPGFSGILLRFSANQHFWGCACTPCTPTSNTTTFHISIIGNFMVYQDRLETNLLQLFGNLENSEKIFYKFCYYFWGQHCWWTEANIYGKEQAFWAFIARMFFVVQSGCICNHWMRALHVTVEHNHLRR